MQRMNVTEGVIERIEKQRVKWLGHSEQMPEER